MKYPMLTNYCDILYNEEDHPFLRFYAMDQDIPLDSNAVYFLSSLDGKTDPYTIWPDVPKEDVDELLEFLEDNWLIRRSRVLVKGPGSIQWTLWIPKITSQKHFFANLYNIVIMLWPMWLFLGWLGFWYSMPLHTCSHPEGWGMLGLILGFPIHELGHMCAGLCYGGKIFELGFGFQWFLPIGYVMQESKGIKNPLKLAQINFAGIEANMTFAGILLLLAYFFPSANRALFYAAFFNVFNGILNLLFCDGLDGYHILENLLGIVHLGEISNAVVSRRSARNGLLRHGSTGAAVILICYIVKALSLAFPLILLANLLEVLS